MNTIPFPPRPPGAVLHTVQTAGFAAPPPDIRHAHRIPPAERAAMHPAWTWGAYPPAEVTIHALQDVTLAAEGLVFLPGGALVEASVTQHQPAEIDAARAAVAAGPAPRLDGPHVLCIKRGVANYGHWLAEMLPMALLAHRTLGPGLRFLVPDTAGALGGAIRESLHLAGIAPERIVPLGSAPSRVQTLIMVCGLSLHGLYLSPLVAELLQALAEPVAAAHPGCRLWVSRAGATRRMADERDIGTILHTIGWQVEHPGRLRFADQVALFKGAGLCAGVMGAGLANLLFAPPGARVELFVPAAMPDTFFFLIARLRGLRYRETRCLQPMRPAGPMSWDGVLIETLPELLAAFA